MKPLSELIDEAGDANKHTHDGRPDIDFSFGYSKGHRACFDLLAPALREAVAFMETNVKFGDAPAKTSLEKIRALLSGGGE